MKSSGKNFGGKKKLNHETKLNELLSTHSTLLSRKWRIGTVSEENMKAYLVAAIELATLQRCLATAYLGPSEIKNQDSGS